MDIKMKRPKIHELIHIFYTHEEAATLLGTTRNNYVSHLQRKSKTYDTYMRILATQLIKDLQHEDAEEPHPFYKPFCAALYFAARRSLNRTLVRGAEPPTQ